MSVLKISVALVTGATLLSACGGGGGSSSSSSGASQYIDKLNAFGAVDGRVAPLDPLPATTALPSGTAEYTGFGTLTVNPIAGIGESGGRETVLSLSQTAKLIGDAELNVNFDAQTATGQIDNMFEIQTQDRDVSDYDGRLLIRNTQFGTGAENGRLQTEIDGTLTGEAGTIVVDAVGNGAFVGNSAQGVEFRALAPDNGAVDGEDARILMTIVAER